MKITVTVEVATHNPLKDFSTRACNDYLAEDNQSKHLTLVKTGKQRNVFLFL